MNVSKYKEMKVRIMVEGKEVFRNLARYLCALTVNQMNHYSLVKW